MKMSRKRQRIPTPTDDAQPWFEQQDTWKKMLQAKLTGMVSGKVVEKSCSDINLRHQKKRKVSEHDLPSYSHPSVPSNAQCLGQCCSISNPQTQVATFAAAHIISSPSNTHLRGQVTVGQYLASSSSDASPYSSSSRKHQHPTVPRNNKRCSVPREHPISPLPLSPSFPLNVYPSTFTTTITSPTVRLQPKSDEKQRFHNNAPEIEEEPTHRGPIEWEVAQVMHELAAERMVVPVQSKMSIAALLN